MKYLFLTLCFVLTLHNSICYHSHNHQNQHDDNRHNNNKPFLNLVYEWKDLEFEFPSDNDKNDAIASGKYVQGNGVPIDVDAYYKKNGEAKVFMTIPRFATGIAMTLVTVSKKSTGPGGPKLKPYPNYQIQSSQGTDCNGITSVFRVMIDACKQMWVLDTGTVADTQFCPPQLLVFDLNTDELIHRYKFPASQFKANVSLFVTPIVDTRDPPPHGSCQHSKVYIADVTGYGIIVYDSSIDSSWRVENPLIFNEPGADIITVAGETFTLPDGVLGMSVTPQEAAPCDRNLYFHALAGVKENAVPLEILDNKKIWKNKKNAMPNKFNTVFSRTNQSAAEAMDSQGNLFFGLMTPSAIASWNINTPHKDPKIRLTNEETLQFASGMKVIRNKMRREELWVLTCRFQKAMTGTMDRKNQINFRIQGNLVDNLLSN